MSFSWGFLRCVLIWERLSNAIFIFGKRKTDVILGRMSCLLVCLCRHLNRQKWSPPRSRHDGIPIPHGKKNTRDPYKVTHPTSEEIDKMFQTLERMDWVDGYRHEILLFRYNFDTSTTIQTELIQTEARQRHGSSVEDNRFGRNHFEAGVVSSTSINLFVSEDEKKNIRNGCVPKL